MATINFSVPDDVKSGFDEVFGGGNQSARIADLMRKAVAEARRREERLKIFRELTQDRDQHPPLSDEDIWEARVSGRP